MAAGIRDRSARKSLITKATGMQEMVLGYRLDGSLPLGGWLFLVPVRVPVDFSRSGVVRCTLLYLDADRKRASASPTSSPPTPSPPTL
jgi:hypothetical protein